MVAVKAGAATGNPDEIGASGVVRHVREKPVPQVFFNELNGALLIDDGLEYAKFYNVLTTSMRTKKPVQFVYNKKTMKLVSVEGAFSKTHKSGPRASPLTLKKIRKTRIKIRPKANQGIRILRHKNRASMISLNR